MRMHINRISGEGTAKEYMYEENKEQGEEHCEKGSKRKVGRRDGSR